MRMNRIYVKLAVLLLTGWVLGADMTYAGNNSGQAFSKWPDTGQKNCYDADGEILNPCPLEGQPFHGQDAQYAGPARSYTDLGNGTVRDNVTGLIWEQKRNMDDLANYDDPHDADNTYTWCDPNPDTNGGDQGTCGYNDTQDFINQLNTANFGGASNWRLPTIKELATLTDLSGTDPAIAPVFAVTTHSYYYWSSTTVANTTFVAWMVSFYGGSIDVEEKGDGYHARAVRGGQ